MTSLVFSSILSFVNFISGVGNPSNSQVSVTSSPLSRDENVVLPEDLSRIKTGLSAMKSGSRYCVNSIKINFEKFSQPRSQGLFYLASGASRREILGTRDIRRGETNTRVVRKPINANPGLKLNRGNSFSFIKVLSISYVLCSLRLLMLKTEGQKI